MVVLICQQLSLGISANLPVPPCRAGGAEVAGHTLRRVACVMFLAASRKKHCQWYEVSRDAGLLEESGGAGHQLCNWFV